MFTSPLNGGYNALALRRFARVSGTPKTTEFTFQISEFRRLVLTGVLRITSAR
jgi:hypothetical protein